jgi:hypothetical protein
VQQVLIQLFQVLLVPLALKVILGSLVQTVRLVQRDQQAQMVQQDQLDLLL